MDHLPHPDAVMAMTMGAVAILVVILLLLMAGGIARRCGLESLSGRGQFALAATQKDVHGGRHQGEREKAGQQRAAPSPQVSE